MLDIDYLRKNNLILFEVISGSRAYNLATEESDTDIKGVFCLPQELFFGFDPVEQVANDSHDIVFYELKKFFQLLAKNNPTVLEMLYTPEDCVLFEHPLFTEIRKRNFLSKVCRDTFGAYAIKQIQKARGLKKKIVNPQEEKRQSVIDFCYVTCAKGSMPLVDWLSEKDIDQESCGLAKLNNFTDVYQLYCDADASFRGVLKSEESADVCTSSIPKGLLPAAYLFFNRDAFKLHCKEHKEYWDWVSCRNEVRYQTNLSHGKDYDSKNMMHVFRLLSIAKGIAVNGSIDLRGHDREFLLSVKRGELSYEELLSRAEREAGELEVLFEGSGLREFVDVEGVEELLVETRVALLLSNRA